jgi:hypothetical protein
LKEVRYFLAADRDADQSGGDCFEELDKTQCCQFTVITVEFYRTDPTDPTEYGKKLVAVYDGSATPQARINRSASFFSEPGSLIPAKFVPIDSPEAQYGYVRRDTQPATIANWRSGELSIWSLNGSDQFATAKQAGGTFPAYTGVENAYWKPAARPMPSGTGLQLETLTLAQLRTRKGSYAGQYVVTDAPAGPGVSLLTPGYDEGPTLLFTQDKDNLAPFGFSGGFITGNDDGLVQVYAQGTRDLVLPSPAQGSRDPYNVPTAKRKAVVDANVAAVPEPDEAYYGCEFVDEVYGPSQPAYYKCMPSAPAQPGGATLWKWFRLDIL